VLVLDEPTSSLSQQEASRLFDVIRSIVANEAAVIFVSHRLDEVFALTSTITVLRDGRLAGTWPTCETDASEITRAMVGPLADERSPQASGGKATSVAIALNGASRAMPAGIELKLHAGEVVGLAGLEGSGVSDVLEMLGGVAPVKGRIEVAGKAVRFRHPLDALRAGVAYMPPDRKKDGLWLQRDNAFNIGVAALSRKAPFSRINHSVLDKVAIPRLVQVGVRESALREAAGNLSGGNQQRVLLGRALEAQPQVLLLSDFTRGVDVSAKAAIHQIIRSLAAEGMTICATSSDLEELLGVAERIVCLRSGKIVADAPSATFDKLSLLALASGA
jgi:ABC-type sugar transport system ATPase subunit